MNFARGVLLLAMCFALVWSTGSYARETLSSVLRGTWHSEKGSITFKNNGTINFKGKRYYYAADGGGQIRLTGKKSSRAIPYHIAGDKLTLTIDGESTVYTRKPTRKK